MPTIDATTWVSPNHSTRDVFPPAVFVLHATVGGKLSSLRHLCNPRPINPRTGLLDPLQAVSTHYVIDKSGLIYQLVADNRVAWHAGEGVWRHWTNLNAVSIGVELVNKNDGKDPYTKAQIDALTWLAVMKQRQHRIDLSNFIRHRDFALYRGKTDPLGFPWDQWKARLKMEFVDRDPPVAPTPPVINDGDKWALWGTEVPLYEPQKQWGIPQAWLKVAKRLGEARSTEVYPGDYVVQVFQHGVVLYKEGKTEIVYAADIGVKK